MTGGSFGSCCFTWFFFFILMLFGVTGDTFGSHWLLRCLIVMLSVVFQRTWSFSLPAFDVCLETIAWSDVWMTCWVLLYYYISCDLLGVNDPITNFIVETCGSEFFCEPTSTTTWGSYFMVDALRHFVLVQVKGTSLLPWQSFQINFGTPAVEKGIWCVFMECINVYI